MQQQLEISNWLDTLRKSRVIAVIRTQEVAVGLALANAIAAGGGRLIEVAWNSNQPAQLIETLRDALPHYVIGCGTVLNQADLQDAIAAGAQFGFMPHVEPDLIRYACDRAWPIHPGALTPTEITTAWHAGATGVKVFPSMALGGSEYIRHLQGPLGHIPLIPTGGVTLQNAGALIAAGAIAVGLGGDLMPQSAVSQQNWLEITQRMQHVLRSLPTQVVH